MNTLHLQVHVLYGEPGTGKSMQAFELARRGASYYYKPRGEWWDGYQQDEVVVVDDFYGWLKWDELLKICDRYPYRVPVKGGYRQFHTHHLVLTSNSHYSTWYNFVGYNPAALERRLTTCIRFEKRQASVLDEFLNIGDTILHIELMLDPSIYEIVL